MVLTAQKLIDMEPAYIFAQGQHSYNELTNKEIKWVAVRGRIHDWAIYYGLVDWSTERIKREGDKVFTKELIKKLVPCDVEAFKLYRY